MLRVITEFQPRWIIGENVRGIVNIGGMEQQQGETDLDDCSDNEDGDDTGTGTDGVLWRIIDDLEQIGYAVQTFIIPACAVNAPHRRDRVWIVGHSKDDRLQYSGIEADSECAGGEHGEKSVEGTDSGDAPDTGSQGLQGSRNKSRGNNTLHNRGTDWSENWLEVATELCGVDDGLPAELYFIGGLENGKMEGIKTESEVNVAIRKILRFMWDQKEITKTSQDLYERGFYNLVLNLPPKSSHQKWNMGRWCKETAELHNMWERFYSEGLTPTSDLQCKVLECIRQIERTKKMGDYTKAGHRVERLKALGNAIVPQVAIEIMTAIRLADENNQTNRLTNPGEK